MKLNAFPATILVIFMTAIPMSAQPILTDFEPGEMYPFGRLNPEAPPETADFAPLIGICDCKSLQRKPDGTWPDTLKMVWKFKYIMNGTAVQDEVWRENGMYAGSIRQYHKDSAQWVVTYFSYPYVTTKPGVWLGKKVNEEIILYTDQKAPNGMEGKSRLTFYDVSNAGFKWRGAWVSSDGTIVYPFWTIECVKRE